MSASDELHPVIQRTFDRFEVFKTKEGREKFESFVPRPTDVIIATAPKCGTTWMQQITHQLRSGGDMTFQDIDDVVLWIDVACDVGQDLDDEHKYQPRCFKTHAWYEACPKGAKYIVVYREPCASFYSGFKFFEGKYFNPGEITSHEFIKAMFLTRSEKNYFEHLVGWWPKRNDPNVLILLYEDMLEDLESAVRAIASFMGIDNEASIKNAVKMSRFEFMKLHEGKFTTNRFSRYRNKALGFAEDKVSPRVVTGSATKGREAMEESTRQAVQDMWDQIVTKEIGFRNYNEFREAFKR